MTKPATKTIPSSISLHKVTFNETGSGCGSYGAGPTFKIDYVPNWYATLGNIMMVQPSNATLPLPNPEGQNSPNFAAISKITFTVPDGSYPYHVSLGQDKLQWDRRRRGVGRGHPHNGPSLRLSDHFYSINANNMFWKSSVKWCGRWDSNPRTLPRRLSRL
jgi:hypothetical protein